MNRIRIVDNKIVDYDQANHLFINDYNRYSSLSFNQDTIFIYINANMEIELDLEYNYKAQDIIMVLDGNSHLKLFVHNTGTNKHGQIKYIILDNCKLVVNSFGNTKIVDEKIELLLNGVNVKIEYHFSTISHDNQLYNINIHHNNQQTYSNIINHGIALDKAKLQFNVNGYIAKGNSKSNLNQRNKIIVLGANQSIINPNLYIDENDVEAKHSAVIGRFSHRDLFYLKSRGIDEEMAIKLMAKGFLLAIIDIPSKKREEIIKSINAHWE
ncbi:MAG: SufB/SufD family protein [Bacilli bacterium]|jgi:hypothetical protein